MNETITLADLDFVAEHYGSGGALVSLCLRISPPFDDVLAPKSISRPRDCIWFVACFKHLI